MTDIIQETDRQLAQIGKVINEKFEFCLQQAKTALEHAREVGERLIEAKALVKHGQWSKWAKANLKFSLDTAERMMKVHHQWDRLKSASVPILSVNDAVRYLTSEKKKEATQEFPIKRCNAADPASQSRNDDIAPSAELTEQATTTPHGTKSACSNCGNTEFDEDDDCTECHEPRVWPRPKNKKNKFVPEDKDESVLDEDGQDSDVADDEPCSVRDSYVDPAEADLFHPEVCFDEDTFIALEIRLEDMERGLAAMFDHEAVASLSDHDPLKVELIRLQRALDNATAGLERKRPVEFAA